GFVVSTYGQTKSYEVVFNSRVFDDRLAPQSYLSQRALNRREKAGISLTWRDQPIPETHLKAVRKIASVSGPHSKWLNAMYVEATTQEVLLLEELSFVQYVRTLQGGTIINEEPIPTLDYGYSLDQTEQISLHQGPHAFGFLGQNMLIAVLDAGFVGANSVTISDTLSLLLTKNWVNGGSNVFQGSSHGFSVLSTMASNLSGTFVGTAPKATYMLLKTEAENSETPVEMYNWVAAAEFADSVGADVINSSLGYYEFDDPADNYTVSQLDGRTSVISLGALHAARAGMLVVTSAGNEGGGPWNKITFPADTDSILTVGSVNQYGTVSAFSSRGYSADGRVKPNVCARGEGAAVFRSDGVIAYGNGTSFSSPILAGACASLWQSVPEATAQEVLRAVEVSASHFYSRNERIGYGVPNLAFAQKYLQNVVLGLEAEVIVYPNPFADNLELFLPDSEALDIELDLRDLNSRTVASSILYGKRYQALWSPGNEVPAGVYILYLRRGGIEQRIRVIKTI
ncbi:MAG: hypothetical protein RLZZ599_1519, partial [Bacteroidota bacterium]